MLHSAGLDLVHCGMEPPLSVIEGGESVHGFRIQGMKKPGYQFQCRQVVAHVDDAVVRMNVPGRDTQYNSRHPGTAQMNDLGIRPPAFSHRLLVRDLMIPGRPDHIVGKLSIHDGRRVHEPDLDSRSHDSLAFILGSSRQIVGGSPFENNRHVRVDRKRGSLGSSSPHFLLNSSHRKTQFG